MAKVTTYRAAYTAQRITVCEAHATTEAAGWPVGPVEHGQRDGRCEVCARPDVGIFSGVVPAPWPEGVPLPAPGVSYYGDRRAEGYDHATAARLAARDMGAALCSIARVRRW